MFQLRTRTSPMPLSSSPSLSSWGISYVYGKGTTETDAEAKLSVAEASVAGRFLLFNKTWQRLHCSYLGNRAAPLFPSLPQSLGSKR